MRAAIARGALGAVAPGDPVHLVAAGKAAWPMASAFSAGRERVEGGVVSGPRTPSLSGADPIRLGGGIDWFDGGHPWPNDASERAGRRALAVAAASRAQGTLVVLLSGGASAMLAVPAEGMTLAAKTAAARALIGAGTPIGALNCVRKHLSAIKGGWLGSAAGRTLTLAISDVHAPVEDDPAVIGSGPTAGDPTTFADALEVIRQSGATVPDVVTARLLRGAAGWIADTPKPRDRAFERSTYTVIGGRRVAMAGARDRALELGYAVRIFDPPTTGEAREAARTFFDAAMRAAASRQRRLCFIASGETTVRVRGDGRGGRNQEFALAGVPLLAGLPDAALASAGTDGIDGPTDAAGAIVDTSTLMRCEAAGLRWREALARNDAYDFFRVLGDLVTWGPTGTNVGDVHVLILR